MGDTLRAAALVLLCAALAAAIPDAGDYTVELGPAMSALLSGHVHDFATVAPVYGASAWPRVPFAALADALGGADLAVYRAGAFACLLAAAALAWWLERTLRADGRPALDRWAVVAVVLGAPVVLRTLRDGHPEDVLAGVLAVAAVLAAARGRAIPAGVALGLAVTAKPWAVLAVLPVLLAAPRGRVVLLAAAGLAAAAVYLPILLLAEHRGGADLNAVVTTGRLFHPQQLLWPLREAHTLGGGVTAYTAPAWAGRIAHPAIVLAGVALTAIWGLRRRATGAVPDDALLALAACLMLRCLLDPWNLAYYAVPPMLALVAWEALRRDGLPVLTIALGALTWLSFVELPRLLGWDALAAAYLLWAAPFTALLWVRLLHPAALAPLRRALDASRQPASSATAARTSPSAT